MSANKEKQSKYCCPTQYMSASFSAARITVSVDIVISAVSSFLSLIRSGNRIIIKE